LVELRASFGADVSRMSPLFAEAALSFAVFSARRTASRSASPLLYYAKVDPLLDNLHGYPRYDALLRKMKLVE
jgi:hypothetical protein